MLTTTIDCVSLNRIITAGLPTGFKILFATMLTSVAAKPLIVSEHKPGFVPHSIFFDFEKDFSDKNSTLSNMMSPIEDFQLSVQALGLNLHDEIVVYDDFGNFCASRVWFMLISVGFTNVKTLQGGLPKWCELGFDTQTDTLQPTQVSDVKLSPSNHYTFVDANYVLSILNGNEQNIQILDARSYGRFSGTEPDPRANTRSGHIPSSICMHYTSLLTEGCFKSEEQLLEIFDHKNIRLENQIITSCGSGITACILAQAAFSLGAINVKVYDASWSQWGANHSLPIKTLGHD